MSHENVEKVLTLLDAFVQNDLEAVLRLADPEGRFEPQLAALQGTYVGHDGLRRFFADASESMSIAGVDCPDIRDLGDRVLAIGTFRISGTASGIEAQIPFAIVAAFREGLITDLRDYGNKGEALEAAGLSNG